MYNKYMSKSIDQNQDQEPNSQMLENLIEFIKHNKDPKAISSYIEELSRDDPKYWAYMSESVELEDDYMVEHRDELDWVLLCKNQRFGEEFLLREEVQDKIQENIDLIVEFQFLPEEFITQYVENRDPKDVKWRSLCKRQRLTEDFMRKYKDHLDWHLVSQEQWMTLEFIMEFVDIDENGVGIHWEVLPTNQELEYLLNDGFVILFQNKDIWGNIGWIRNMTEECVERFKDKIPLQGWIDLLGNKRFTTEFVEKLVQELEMNDDLWEAISSGQRLNQEFMERYQDELNWFELSLHQKFDIDFIFKMKDKISLNNLSMNDCLNEQMIEQISEKEDEFDDELDWVFISEYGNISKEFAERNDKVIKTLFRMNEAYLEEESENLTPRGYQAPAFPKNARIEEVDVD